jgi:hypothetical protein
MEDQAFLFLSPRHQALSLSMATDATALSRRI